MGKSVEQAKRSSHSGTQPVRRSMRQIKNDLFCLACIVAFSAAAAPSSDGSSIATLHYLYAVNQSRSARGSISVYDMDGGHRLVKTLRTPRRVADVRGIAASAATGKLYVAYRTLSNEGMIFCLNIDDDRVLWDKVISPGVDRLAIDPSGRMLYVPTWEDNAKPYDYINVVDAKSGDVLTTVHFSNHSHDAQFPLSGPIFQETKASDGSGRFLYLIDPGTYAVSHVGPFSDVLGPFAVNGRSTYAVINVTNLWGMAVVDLKSGRIVIATIPQHPAGEPDLLHGIAWTPNEREVWESSSWTDPHIYIWDMADPARPQLAHRLRLKSGEGASWITFDIDGHYAYVAPNKDSERSTEVFDARTHVSVGTIRSSEDMLEVDFANGTVSRVGDQYGIGRALQESR